MLRHGIEMAQIDARRKPNEREKIVMHRFDYSGTYALAMVHLGFYVAMGMGDLKAHRSFVSGWSETAVVVGHESDVAHAVQLIASLQLQAVVALRAWRKTAEYKNRYAWRSAADKMTASKSFVEAFGMGAGQRLARNRRVETKAAEAAPSGTGTALVLADRKAAVQAYVDGEFGKFRKARQTRRDYSAADAGHRAGLDANTHETAVGGSRGALGS